MFLCPEVGAEVCSGIKVRSGSLYCAPQDKSKIDVQELSQLKFFLPRRFLTSGLPVIMLGCLGDTCQRQNDETATNRMENKMKTCLLTSLA